MDIGPFRRQCRGFLEKRDGGVVVLKPQGIECFGQRFVCGVFLLLSQRGGGDQAERGKSNRCLPLALVGKSPEISLIEYCFSAAPSEHRAALRGPRQRKLHAGGRELTRGSLVRG